MDPPSDRIRWAVPPRNLGYGSACEYGAGVEGANRYAFFNADVDLGDDAIDLCLHALDAPGVGISGPVLLQRNGELQSGCGTWTPLLRSARASRWPVADVSRCEWVTGAAMFCRAQVVTEVGFDGSYFLGAEDADLCDRAALRGWATVVVRDAQGYHRGGATMTGGRWQYYTIRNRVWFLRKRRSRWAGWAYWVWSAFVLLPRVAVADTVKRRGYVLSYSAWRGLLDAATMLPPGRQPWAREPVPAEWMPW
ncbi:MAG: glycosyltransferase family 2 protein [Acidimicrobiales bacterium]